MDGLQPLHDAEPVDLGWQPKAIKAWYVTPGIVMPLAMIQPVHVTAIEPAKKLVKWRVPNQPYDIERIAPMVDMHSTLDGAMAHAKRLLEQLVTEPPAALQK